MSSITYRLSLLGLAVCAPLLAFLVLAIARPSTADAHPLGNFTVNRYTRLELYSDVIRIRYVLDMAEIPAFQEIETVDADGDAELSDAENGAYLATKVPELQRNLHLSLNGVSAELRVLITDISYPEGQAGLRTLRLSFLSEARLGSGSQFSLEYRDDNYADRIGWREVVVRPASGVGRLESSAPTQDVSRELTAYPQDLLSSPLDIGGASVSFEPGDGASAPPVEPVVDAARTAARASERSGGAFASLINAGNLTLPVILLSLLAAFGFGALHALEPGHGKTFVAAYFVGARGTARQAISLGLIIAVTHTAGVLAIGVITLFGSQFILPERLYPWLSLASALMILALGVRLVASRSRGLRFWRYARTIMRRTSHKQSQEPRHRHSHLPAEVGAPPWRSLLALGLADGLTPSPSALLVLLAAVSLNRIGLGLLLIAAFSVGLATVLTLVSLALVYARRFLDWIGESSGSLRARPCAGWIMVTISGQSGLIRAVPLAGAVVLMAVGAMLTIRALSQQPLVIF